MSLESENPARRTWVDACGIAQLLRVPRMAAQPGKLALALVGIILTLAGGVILDGVWSIFGQAISQEELPAYLTGTTPPELADDAPTAGVFRTFAAFEIGCVRDAIESVRYGRLIGPIRAGEMEAMPPAAIDGHPVRGAFANLVLMGRGVAWLITQHYVFAVVFIPLVILTWSLCGGAICRVAAIQAARDETPLLRESLEFARSKLIDGFFTAPLLPLGVCLVVALALMLGGVVLSIPWLGDLVAGVLFGLALLGGLVIAVMLIGLVFGGSLLWPTIAVESSDAFDAVSRSLSYGLGRPLRAIWYALWLIVLGSFCWLFVAFAAWMLAAATHLFVGIGSGLASREGAANKLSALWASPTFEQLHDIPGPLSGGDWISAVLIGIWTLLLWGLVWSYLMSFYFTGSTAAYYLLRRDADGTELCEIDLGDEDDDDQQQPATAQPTKDGDVALPVVNAPQ